MRRGTKRRRNPYPTTQTKREEYPVEFYAGTVLSPKSLVPMAIYVNRAGSFRAFSPNRELMYGAGYFGADQWNCPRQHMQPGVEDSDDRGSGMGTALYVAGNMVVAAGVFARRQNLRFPGEYEGIERPCTHSVEGDRSSDAEQAWANMEDHGLATLETAEGEQEEISERWDVDDYVDRDAVLEAFGEAHNYDEITTFDITGTIEIEAWRSEEKNVNFMYWGTIRLSGLILHLNERFFGAEALNRAAIPPEPFARASWVETPDSVFQSYVDQNIQILGDDGPAWVRETACLMDYESYHAQFLLSLIGEDAQMYLPGVRANPPRQCPAYFLQADRQWMQRWGPGFREPNPKRKNKRSRRVRNLERKLLR